jgi:hypothetical protein
VFASLIVLPGYLAVMVTTLARLVLAQEIGQQALKKSRNLPQSRFNGSPLP